MASIWYCYGIVAAESAGRSAPSGLDDAAVEARRVGDVAALVSELDAVEYEPTAVEAHSGDVDWVAARAVAHDRVLTWASDRGPVIPLPMFTSMFRTAAGIDDMLRTRAASLHAVLDRVGKGREYALRVYRVDAELKAAMPSLDPEIAALAQAAQVASPGQRYLLERKLDERIKDEVRMTSNRIAGEVRDQLSTLSIDTTLSPIARVTADAPGTMVLNAAFLVAPDRLRAFQERLTAIVTERQPSGFRFDFTGPWPPYHFVAGALDE